MKNIGVAIFIVFASSNTIAQFSNVSVGSTQNAYLGPSQYGALEFPRGSLLFSNTNSQNQLYLTQNGYMGNDGSFKFRNNNPATSIGLDNGQLYFFTSGSGAPGSTISLDPKMMITNNGNVGIGTTLPSYKLHVKNPDIQLVLQTDGTGNNRSLVAFSNSAGVLKGSVGLFGGDETIRIGDASDYRLVIKQGGDIGIGTTTPDSKLTVKGTIHSQEVKVDLNGSVAPDYVFEKDYPLASLSELKSYIDQNKHLPEIPSAKEMEENGINLKEMNLLLLKKVEELTLHLIEQNDKVEKLNIENIRQDEMIQNLLNRNKQ